MASFLNPAHFPSASPEEEQKLSSELETILRDNMRGDSLRMLGDFQRILSSNARRSEWEPTLRKLDTLFKCGACVPLDGPMIGVSMGIRDSDYFRTAAQAFGRERSKVAEIGWMASVWNATLAASGLWMGKTFEPVSRESYAASCGAHPGSLSRFETSAPRVGRNFFRESANPQLFQRITTPFLGWFWNLEFRPRAASPDRGTGAVTDKNLRKEMAIPYERTGGHFLAALGESVLSELRGKNVYQLNYRWPALRPAYPMTRLIDEIVQLDQGIYLGQLVMATRDYSLGNVLGVRIGKDFDPARAPGDYGYQNNGYFLMIDPDLAKDAYSDRAFAFLRPRLGETGYRELGYDAGKGGIAPSQARMVVDDWKVGWAANKELAAKFTTFVLEDSPLGAADGDARELLREGESVLQMLQRIQKEISSAALFDDHLRHFEQLNRLFRRGVAPRIVDGMFQGRGADGYNSRFDAPEPRSWYGQPEPCTGFDYYHGATLNLHFGFADTFVQGAERKIRESHVSPAELARLLREGTRGPDVLDAVWATIGRFIFPWAGKSFERISGRRLSMILDESDDLAERYPERVAELRNHPASWPHYDLVLKNRDHHWPHPGAWAQHLQSGSWDRGMTEADKEFWRREAATRWVWGNNIQDNRILPEDSFFRALDMNYGAPLPSIQALADRGPSPFVRQGYSFMGTSDRQSILPMNNGPAAKKQVFQFHYRYPMIGGAMPIGMCLDELVEIADGLYLGQLIYTTAPFRPFQSSEDPSLYRYQLFGYFLLLDNVWERHRRAIGFDVDTL